MLGIREVRLLVGGAAEDVGVLEELRASDGVKDTTCLGLGSEPSLLHTHLNYVKLKPKEVINSLGISIKQAHQIIRSVKYMLAMEAGLATFISAFSPLSGPSSASASGTGTSPSVVPLQSQGLWPWYARR